ncbi:MAG: alpha/beta hydrolase [Pseudomonadota bacterium]
MIITSKIPSLVGLLALAASLGLSYPVAAQTTPPVETQASSAKYGDYRAKKRKIEIESRVFSNEKGESVEGEMGFIYVPEVRSDPNSRLIKVAFIRIKTESSDPAPPVVLLHGGPKESAILQSRMERIQVLTEMQSFADFILLDARGMGLSEPLLGCDIDTIAFVVDADTMRELYTREGEACNAYWTSQGTDLRGYNPIALADDVADLMVSLGYDAFSVTGNSYGAFWSIALARRHPELLHRMAISGVFGLDGALNLPSDAQAAFEDLLDHLDADEQVQDMFGERGASGVFNDLAMRLEREPVEVVVQFNGQPLSVRLDSMMLARILYMSQMTHHREGASILPSVLYALDKEAYRGVMQVVATQILERANARFNIAAVATICNEVYTNAFREQFDRELLEPPESAWMGQMMKTRNASYACEALDYPLIDSAWAEPFNSNIPVLAILGSFDGNTPPARALRSLDNFSDVTLITANGGGHRHREIEALAPDIYDMRLRFLAGEDIDDAPAEVDLPPLDITPLPAFARFLISIGLGNIILEQLGS